MYANERPVLPPATRLKLYVLFHAILSLHRIWDATKPFVIDRKNFLFANTPRGAKASAVMFSLIETAKENGLNPFEYLVYVFKNAPNWNIRNNPDALERLLPAFVPGYIRSAANSCAPA